MLDEHEIRCAKLYEIGNRPEDIPDGLFVIGGANCALCKNSMRNNNYASATHDGTPVTWLDAHARDGINKFYATPGVSYDDAADKPRVNGVHMVGSPMVLFVRNNAIVGKPLKFGEIMEGELESLLAKARTENA